jgi:hypothetical protein
LHVKYKVWGEQKEKILKNSAALNLAEHEMKNKRNLLTESV